MVYPEDDPNYMPLVASNPQTVLDTGLTAGKIPGGGNVSDPMFDVAERVARPADQSVPQSQLGHTPILSNIDYGPTDLGMSDIPAQIPGSVTAGTPQGQTMPLGQLEEFNQAMLELEAGRASALQGANQEQVMSGLQAVPYTSSTPLVDVWQDDDWYAGGGIYDDNTAIVGESGPELAIFPIGTEIVPLDRRMKRSQARRLRRRGVRGMEEGGGFVFGNGSDSALQEQIAGAQESGAHVSPSLLGAQQPKSFEESIAPVREGEIGDLPIGIQQVLRGRSPRPLAGRLLRQAGMTLPSAQAWRNLSPDEQSVYTDLGRRSGISEGYLQAELATSMPSGGGGARRGRMLPLATRRGFRR
jgi:hypothetical protein